MCGAADHLRAQPGVEGSGVGSVGFCLGGGLSVWAAANCPNVAAAVTYYYVMPHGKPDFAQGQGPRARALRHGRRIHLHGRSRGARGRAEARRASTTTFHYYDGAGHAFANDPNRLGTYDAALTELAWQRTVEFLRGALA